MTTTEPTTITLDYDEAVDLLNRAVAERGEDFVYRVKVEAPEIKTCVYFNESGPSCIVGHLLAYKGVETLNEFDNETGVSAFFPGGSPYRVRGLQILADDRTQDLLEHAQTEQDNMTPWGDALGVALAETERGADIG